MSNAAIYCCGCKIKVSARLTDGRETYPHRPDLASLPFWKCDLCGNFVGCHHKTKDRTKPLGCIPTKEIKSARQQIHLRLDPIWQSGQMSRKSIYAELANRLGWKRYHTANVRSLDEAKDVVRVIAQIQKEINGG